MNAGETGFRGKIEKAIKEVKGQAFSQGGDVAAGEIITRVLINTLRRN
jgi:hypothetical protein